MSDSSFLKLMFDGGRFGGHFAPVDVLAELATVEELIARVVRRLYFQRHPGRQRIAHGFLASSRLYLTSTEKNCFTAGLDRPTPWAGADAADALLFEEARDLTIEALRAVSEGRALPMGFPSEAYDPLAALGRRLELGENIIVKNGKPEAAAVVNLESRARLANMMHRPLETIEEIEGEVEKVDDDDLVFTLRTSEDERITGITFDSTQRSDVVAALTNRPVARILLRALFSKGRTKSVTRVESLQLLDDDRAPDVQRVWERLDSFKNVADGWLDGHGIAPSDPAIAAAREILARLLVDSDAPRPSVYPTPDGGVQAEWILGIWVAEVVFSNDGRTVNAAATNTETGEDKADEFSKRRVSRDDATALANWLRSFNETDGHV